VLRSADLAPTVHGERIERAAVRHTTRGRVVGIAFLIVIYGVAVYASIGLVHQPSGSGGYVASMLLGALNMLALPLLVLAAVAGVRRMWRDGAPSRGICRLLTAPLWASFMVSLLTVPLWMGMANAGQQGEAHAALTSSATFLLAPWGFMLAYGLSLFVICAMYDFTFPIVVDESPQSNVVGMG
jgi:hypothetical protein